MRVMLLILNIYLLSTWQNNAQSDAIFLTLNRFWSSNLMQNMVFF